MKKSKIGTSILFGVLALPGIAQQPVQSISQLPADVVMRAWTDPAFRADLKNAPGRASSELIGANVHFDSDDTINVVVSSGAKIHGDTARLLSVMSHVGYRTFDEATRQQLEIIAFSKLSSSEVSFVDGPSSIKLGASGIKLVIHRDGLQKHFSVPLNPIDIEHAAAIERQAVHVASSTTCCASGTCDIGGLPWCSTWG